MLKVGSGSWLIAGKKVGWMWHVRAVGLSWLEAETKSRGRGREVVVVDSELLPRICRYTFSCEIFLKAEEGSLRDQRCDGLWVPNIYRVGASVTSDQRHQKAFGWDMTVSRLRLVLRLSETFHGFPKESCGTGGSRVQNDCKRHIS